VALSHTCEFDGGDPSCYKSKLFKDRSIAIIESHDVETPLFLFHSFGLVHTPLEVPKDYITDAEQRVAAKAAEGVEPFDALGRKSYAAMVTYMDEAIGEIEAALKKKDMWDNTLMVFISDNGGPIYVPGNANNFPLKGGKYSDWEGGTRTVAVVSGGYVPKTSRGAVYGGVISIADWQGMFAELAGAEHGDPEGEARGMPAVDSTSGLWEAMTAVSASPVFQTESAFRGENLRTQIHLSAESVLDWPWKLVTGKQVYSKHQGPVFPNCSHTMTQESLPMFIDFKVFHHSCDIVPPEMMEAHLWTEDCDSHGCLFNVEADPEERTNRAADPEQKERLATMHTLLRKFNEKLFKPDRGHGAQACCTVASEQGGYYGPWLGDIDEYYTAPIPESANSIKSILYRKVVMPFLHVQLVQDFVIKITAYLTISGDPPRSMKMTEVFRVCEGDSFDENEITLLSYMMKAFGISL
jgi:arylsulfatase I/J